MKKKCFIAVVMLIAAIIGTGCSLGGGMTGQGAAEPEEEIKAWQEAEPSEFETEEIFWFDLQSRNEDTEKTEDISIDMYQPEDAQATLNGEKYELSVEQCNELRQLILEYSQTVKEQEDEYWPDTDEYPDMLVLFKFEMTGEKKRYRASGALCYPDGWEEFVGELKEIIGRYEPGQKIEGPEESSSYNEITPFKNATTEMREAAPSEFEKDEIIYFNLFYYHENSREMEGITLWLYPGEEEADINNETIKLNEEQCDELRRLILQYSLAVKEQEDEYWPSDADEAAVMAMLFDFEMLGEEKEYIVDGALCYPDGWEEFVENLKEIIL